MNAQIGNLFTFTHLRMWVESGLVSNNVRGNSWCIFLHGLLAAYWSCQYSKHESNTEV